MRPVVRAALEILVAWARAIPLEKLGEFLEHREREIRILAFRLASFVAIDSDSRQALLRALGDADDGDSRGWRLSPWAAKRSPKPSPHWNSAWRARSLEEARLAACCACGHAAPGMAVVLDEQSASPNPATRWPPKKRWRAPGRLRSGSATGVLVPY